MINKLKKLYSGYTIFIKKNNFIFDMKGNCIKDKKLIKEKKYIIIDKNSYEIHKKS